MAKIVLTISANNKATQSVRLLNAEVQTLSQTLSNIKVNKNLTTQINALTKHYKTIADAHAKIIASANKEKIEFEKLQQAITKTLTEGVKYEKELARLNNELAKEKLTLEKVNTEKSKQALNDSKAQNSIKITTSQTQRLVKQYADLLNTIKSLEKDYKKGTFDNVTSQIKGYFNEVKGLDDELKNGKITQEDYNSKIIQATASLQGFKTDVASTRTESKNLHGTLRDTASGFLQFQFSAMLIMKPLQLIRSALSSINETLVKTEDAVIALQRVLPNGSASDDEISSRLYKIAADYGQTFENVSQIATNFARTGMSWTDTIKATEAAVLALNVAELDATEASEGLISILNQFGMDASELTSVVDKLNITADNASVTTEKLLAALQRTGSAAANAKLNLDETISAITALSQATNRSGENLGTALNSLIQYSSKAKALDVFADLSTDTKGVVESYKRGAANILDVWKSVSKDIQHLTVEQANKLDEYFASDEGFELKEALDGELQDIYTELNGVYDTANTFRKNYFIALLGNMDAVLQAEETLKDAQGYSQSENEKYLDTYTAKLNTLKAQWEDIANSEQGLLGFKKGLVDISSWILSVVNATGGLRTTFIALGSVIGSVFGGKIFGSAATKINHFITSFKSGEKPIRSFFKNFGNAINPVKKFRTAIDAARKATEAQNAAIKAQKNLTSVLNDANSTSTDILRADTKAKNAATTATDAATASTKAWGSAMKTALGWIGFIATAISSLIGLFQSHDEKERQAAEEAKRRREEIISEWEAVKEEAIAFAELNKQYNDLKDISNKTTEQEKEFLDVQENIVKTLGYKAIALKKLEEGTEEYQDKLKELTDSEVDRYAKQAAAAAKAAKEAYAHAAVGDASGYLGVQFSANAYNFELDNWDNWVDGVDAYLTYLYDNGEKDSDIYSDAYEYYKKLSDAYQTYITTAAQDQSLEYLRNNELPQTQSEIDSLVDSVVTATGASERWRDTIEGVIVELTGFKTPQKEINNWTNDISKIDSSYDDLIKKLEELRDLQKESTDWEEKKKEVLEAEQALLNAKNEATVRRFNQDTNQWEWQTNEKAIAEAEENLEKARLELQENAYDNIIEQLEKGDATNESILAILQEVAPLLGADSNFVDAVTNAFKEKTGVDITKPTVSNFDAAQNYITSNGLKESEREKWAEDKSFAKLWNKLTADEQAKLKGTYDTGGIANGLGFMAKATEEPEVVNDPELTRKILTPVSNAEFDRYVKDMGIMFETARQYNQRPIIERIGGATDNRVDNSGQINFAGGLSVGSEQRDNMLNILSLGKIIPNV